MSASAASATRSMTDQEPATCHRQGMDTADLGTPYQYMRERRTYTVIPMPPASSMRIIGQIGAVVVPQMSNRVSNFGCQTSGVKLQVSNSRCQTSGVKLGARRSPCSSNSFHTQQNQRAPLRVHISPKCSITKDNAQHTTQPQCATNADPAAVCPLHTPEQAVRVGLPSPGSYDRIRGLWLE